MCIGIPVQVIEVKGLSGLARDGGETVGVDLSLTGPVAPGTWVLNFLGAAREVLDPDEALKIRAAVGACAPSCPAAMWATPSPISRIAARNCRPIFRPRMTPARQPLEPRETPRCQTTR
jgi:hydrogenase assembly chaperone HypC/HupF